MSRIDDLISRHCPHGVEFKPLGEVGEFIRGNGLQKKDFTESGVGCIHYGQIHTHYGTYADKTKTFVSEALAKKLRKAKKGSLVIATTSENDADVCKAVAWLGDEEIAVGGDAYIYQHSLNPKYVAYFFNTDQFCNQKRPYITGTKIRRVKGGDIGKIKIPIPPLEVQEEIVAILDAFTKLEAELEAELEARQKQYVYYRDALLKFEGQDVSFMELNSVCVKTANIKWKENVGKEYDYIDLSSVNRKNNKITKVQKINASNAPSRAQQIVSEGDVIFGTTRPTLKRFCFIPKEYEGQICSTGFCILRADKTKILPKYLYFSITTSAFNDYVEHNQEGVGYPAIANAKVKNFKLPIPPIEEQERIVAILDKFDALVNDLSSGLPAEIAARRQQYEHYRNLLLNFPKLEKVEA